MTMGSHVQQYAQQSTGPEATAAPPNGNNYCKSNQCSLPNHGHGLFQFYNNACFSV